MAIARMDRRAVHRLVEQLFGALGAFPGLTLVRSGDVTPDDLWCWAVLASVDVDELPRVAGGDEPDRAALTITIQCGASERARREDGGALSSVISVVTKAMCHQTASSSVHRIDTDGAQATEQQIVGYQDAQSAVASVVVSGFAFRSSGDSLEVSGVAV